MWSAYLPALGFLIVPVASGETSKEPLLYFPLVDLRQFYNTTRYIWTVSTTVKDVCCKVDNPMYETHKEVYFLRNRSDTRLHHQKSEPLRGSYYDLNPWYGPTMMQVSDADRQDYTEQLVYRDENNRCGVFLTLDITPIGDQHFRNTYYSYTACELRVKGTRCGPKKNITACDAAFQDLCGRNQTYKAYNDTCSVYKKPESD
ncbi:uncharacterized protein LOC144144221 [Haemaphysalis longicornis]